MSWIGSVGFSAAVLYLLAGLQAPVKFCDPNLKGGAESSMTYQMREGRCEGIYAQQVGTVSLDLRSFVEGFGSFDPEKDERLDLTWKPPNGVKGDVRLRAFSLKAPPYYRMDTAQPAAQGSYRWPSDVLASVELGDKDLGVIAWLTLPGPADRAREVYLPLRAGLPKASNDGYQVTFVPSKKLKKVLVTLREIDERGTVIKALFSNKDIGGEFPHFPSKMPTVIPTGKIGPAGYYRLEIKATAASGDFVTSDIDFYHSGK